jgi:hypothetical protein
MTDLAPLSAREVIDCLDLEFLDGPDAAVRAERA